MANNVYDELRQEGKLCDAVIRVEDTTFKVHKIILCGLSPYFRALFTSGWSTSETHVYRIPDVSAEIMDQIMKFAYTQSINIREENVEELLVAANYLDISGIVQACCQFLEAKQSGENCIGIWRFADSYSCLELRQKAYLFSLHHFNDVIKSEEFLELSAAQLSSIIENDKLNVKREETVFETIMHWINHAPQERREHIATLLPKVRLGLMSAESLMDVKLNPAVKDNENCRKVINSLQVKFHQNSLGLCDLTIQNSLLRPRLPHTILLTIGGWSGVSPTNIIESFDNRTNQWTMLTLHTDDPRAYHAAVLLNGFVYCVGGFNGDDYFNTVRKFNPISKTWHQVAPMHFQRCYVSACVLNGYIYAMGGFNGYTRTNTAERYDPERNQWEMIAPMHEQRSDASATTFNGKVYICGGFNGEECLFTVECYNPEYNQWSLITPMNSPRSGLGVITYGEKVYAVGGFNGDNRLQSAEVYNPATNIWRDINDMINPRSNFGIEVVDDLMYVVGGYNGLSITSNAECYDEKTDEWCEVCNMEIHRSALSCCVISSLHNVEEYTASRDVH